MKRRQFLTLGSLALASACLHNPEAVAQERSAMRIGSMTVQQFERLNRQSLSSVSAIRPGGERLTRADQLLLSEYATGGLMVLTASRLALVRGVSPDVRVLAQAEIDAQTTVTGKLQETALAKNFRFPTPSRRRIDNIVDRLSRYNGAEFDQAYVVESGIRGNQMMLQITGQILAQAQDPALLAIANAARPLFETHLRVSQEEAGRLAT